MIQMNRYILIIALGLLFSLPIFVSYLQVFAQQYASNESNISTFLEAARANDTGGLTRELGLGVPVDSRDEKGRTALLVATYANAIDSARLLIAAGADVNATDNLKDSPYLYAGAEGKLEILKMTIAAGANLESVNRYGGTALTPAAHHGHVDVVRYLLTTDIDINQINNLGWTALLEAVILGDGSPTYQKIVKLLLDNGADMTIGDDQNVTSLEHARADKQEEIVKLFELVIRRKY
jgi:ankyrin repeat protein